MLDRWNVGISGVLMVFIAVLFGIHLVQINAQPVLRSAHTAKYQVTLETDPATPKAGEPFSLKLRVMGADGKTPVTKFDEVHTKLLHLIIVSQDLGHFLHEHPAYQADGLFTMDKLTLPAAGNYSLFADFNPTGEHQQVVRLTLATQDAKSTSTKLKVSGVETVLGSLRFKLDTPAQLNAGVETKIAFHITDAKTGAEIKDLDEYLGAGGHLVILDQTAETYLHTHPVEHGGDMSGMQMAQPYGPRLEFETIFPATGLYALWLQVQYKGAVLTAPFVVDVTGQAEATPEATMPVSH